MWDVGGMPHQTFLRSVDLLGKWVKSQDSEHFNRNTNVLRGAQRLLV